MPRDALVLANLDSSTVAILREGFEAERELFVRELEARHDASDHARHEHYYEQATVALTQLDAGRLDIDREYAVSVFAHMLDEARGPGDWRRVQALAGLLAVA
jgi:hypothetical protein